MLLQQRDGRHTLQHYGEEGTLQTAEQSLAKDASTEEEKGGRPAVSS